MRTFLRIAMAFLAFAFTAVTNGCVDLDSIQHKVDERFTELQKPIDALAVEMKAISANIEKVAVNSQGLATLSQDLKALAEKLERGLQASDGTIRTQLSEIAAGVLRFSSELEKARKLVEVALGNAKMGNPK